MVVTLSRLWSVVLLFIYILPHFVEDVKGFFQGKEDLLHIHSVSEWEDLLRIFPWNILIIAQDLLVVKGLFEEFFDSVLGISEYPLPWNNYSISEFLLKVKH
jgi:hypothetical protein